MNEKELKIVEEMGTATVTFMLQIMEIAKKYDEGNIDVFNLCADKIKDVFRP